MMFRCCFVDGDMSFVGCFCGLIESDRSRIVGRRFVKVCLESVGYCSSKFEIIIII
jgi:hypothetical protein